MNVATFSIVFLLAAMDVELPVHRDGDFRTTITRLVAVRDLQNDTHTWTIHLEVAWAPDLRPLFIGAQAEELVVKNERGEALKPISQGTGRIAINRTDGVEMAIRVTAPAQSAQKIGLLQGAWTIIGSKKSLDFTFDLEKPSVPNRSPDGVVASLHDFKQSGNIWTIRVRLIYPPDTPDFESFESWLANNEILLESKDGNKRIPANGGYAIDGATDKSAILTYRFVEDKDLTLGKPMDWKVVYRTPGKIEKMPVRFEFKDLPAP